MAEEKTVELHNATSGPKCVPTSEVAYWLSRGFTESPQAPEPASKSKAKAKKSDED